MKDFANVKELANMDLEEFNDSSFRRGYHHGIITVIYLAENLQKEKKTLHALIDTLWKYEQKDVYKWRYQKPTNEMIFPPAPRR